MDLKHKKTESTNLLKSSLITIIGLAVLGIGPWALMFHSAPPSELEPYQAYKESQKNPETEAKNRKPTQDIAKAQEKSSIVKKDLGNLGFI